MPSQRRQPPAKGGGGDKILGMPKGGAIAVFAGAGILVFLWWQSRQSRQQGQQGGQAGGARPRTVYLSAPGHWKRGRKAGGPRG